MKNLPLSKRKLETMAYLKRFGRTMIATPRLREVATGIGLRSPAGAKDHLDWLVEQKLVEKPADAFGGWQVADEPQIPVILGTERVNPDEPLLAEPRIIEKVRGVLAESFKPEPQFFVLLEEKTGLTKMLAISQCSDPQNGTMVVGRIRDEIVVGKMKGQHFEMESCNPKSEMTTRRIAKCDPGFRIDGVVVGSITAQSV